MGYGSSGKKPIEFAGKTGHSEFIDDETKKFISECYIPQENFSTENLENLIYNFKKENDNIRYVITIDGGYSPVIPKERYPSSKFVAIKVGALLLDITKIKELEEEPFISPEKINKIKNIGKSKFLLPIKNVMNQKYKTFTEFVRETIYMFFSKKDFNLAEALKWLAYREFKNNPIDEWNLATHPYNKEIRNINLKRNDFDNSLKIQENDETIYITDILRLHELIDEDIGAEGIVNYLLSAIEQLLMVSIIKEIYTRNPSKLSEFLFILDRPLAFFGQTANLHKPMRELIEYFSSKGINLNIVGLEKSGAFVEHAKEIIDAGLIKGGQYLLLSNEYIYKNILPKTAKNDAIYGRTTYYGGKLIFHSDNGNSNVCSIPVLNYNEVIKEPKPENFINLHYILSIIEELKCDMYENAILPITLINKAVSISKYPGEASLERFIKDILLD